MRRLIVEEQEGILRLRIEKEPDEGLMEPMKVLYKALLACGEVGVMMSKSEGDLFITNKTFQEIVKKEVHGEVCGRDLQMNTDFEGNDFIITMEIK